MLSVEAKLSCNPAATIIIAFRNRCESMMLNCSVLPYITQVSFYGLNDLLNLDSFSIQVQCKKLGTV